MTRPQSRGSAPASRVHEIPAAHVTEMPGKRRNASSISAGPGAQPPTARLVDASSVTAARVRAHGFDQNRIVGEGSRPSRTAPGHDRIHLVHRHPHERPHRPGGHRRRVRAYRGPRALRPHAAAAHPRARRARASSSSRARSRCTATAGERVLRPGQGAHLPAGEPHTFRVTSTGPARMLVRLGARRLRGLRPGRRPPGRARGAAGARRPARRRRCSPRAAEQHGITFVGPPGAVPADSSRGPSHAPLDDPRGRARRARAVSGRRVGRHDHLRGRHAGRDRGSRRGELDHVRRRGGGAAVDLRRRAVLVPRRPLHPARPAVLDPVRASRRASAPTSATATTAP